MAKSAIIGLTLLVGFFAVAVVAVKPQNKLYFAIPLTPAAAPAATPAPAVNTTTANTTTTGAVINIIPLGQVLANILIAIFGVLVPGALNISPLGAVLGYFLGLLFGTNGSNWSPVPIFG